MTTECSMIDNVAVEFPLPEFIRPCNLCPHMKHIILPKILRSLETLQYPVAPKMLRSSPAVNSSCWVPS